MIRALCQQSIPTVGLPECARVPAAAQRPPPSQFPRRGTPFRSARVLVYVAPEPRAQPIKSRTGGSTFKNPPGRKAWQLIDGAGCRGLVVGDAQVSELHCNFLINRGSATAADIETLGETVRARVKENSGVELEWEIKRIGIST